MIALIVKSISGCVRCCTAGLAVVFGQRRYDILGMTTVLDILLALRNEFGEHLKISEFSRTHGVSSQSHLDASVILFINIRMKTHASRLLCLGTVLSDQASPMRLSNSLRLYTQSITILLRKYYKCITN